MKPIYLAALALTLAASAWVWLEDHGMLSAAHEVVEVNAPRQRKTEHQPDTPTVTAPLLRATIGPAEGDPFNAVVPPPPPPPPAAPPPPPQPPPFPFRYFGVMSDESGKPAHFLAKGDALVPVKPGVSLGDGYRVESMNEQTLVVLYEPIPSKTVIQLGSAKP
ncbi:MULTISPECIES: hypothetical protein [Ralstonia solanacearum species complex]|uniref:Prolin-rich protein n=2 Tax=Ralstonia solanacearum TaxID=305 RepID=A0A7U7JE48_RALSL|nr:hypothetical protein [Ralstonia solanacearum]ALF90105.1 hypothetical protein RSUY_37960 [Ralstonia solanacearum]ATI29594.1 hypothetical protein CCY86_19020 [Ralstonia solanacearum]EAP74089.1 proline-rich signal peptide [Ralstonia solanacearum UW551]KEI30263.1 hypothetical protein CQ06_08165 [Ralstonia solanacearum]KFX76993.1 hypothetical protein KR98_21670 [Ralstonia solanacearum]